MNWNGEDKTEILARLGLPIPDRKTRYIVTVTTDSPVDGEAHQIEQCVLKVFNGHAKKVTVSKAQVL